MTEVVESTNCDKWREILSHFDRVDVCHLPEYHTAYASRISHASALLWFYQDAQNKFAYPFLLAPVFLTGPDGQRKPTPYFDISGVYGFSGPLSTTNDDTFLEGAWKRFDIWCEARKAICEFVRFSIYSENLEFAHHKCIVEPNRPISISKLPHSHEAYLSTMSSKTRNMIRRAWKNGLVARSVELSTGLQDFRSLYENTMRRNDASSFFSYDDRYYETLMRLPKDELILRGVFDGNRMVAAAIGLIRGKYGFYHLGASEQTASRVGAGNLALFDLAKGFIDLGVEFFNVGGGRTTDPNDPLFRFKKNNGTGVSQFFIGKRIIDEEGYKWVAKQWSNLYDSDKISNQLQFYR